MTRTTYLGMALAALTGAVAGALLYLAPSSGSELASVAASDLPLVIQTGTPPPPSGTDTEIEPSTVIINASVIGHRAPAPAGYKQYLNAKYGFSFFYPHGSTVKEYEESGGAVTVTVEDFAAMRGFQVYVEPYQDTKITEARFHLDVPSGVRKEVEKASIDGVEAVTFASVDAALGPTREIWTIRRGYLYEITTLADVGEWFIPIIQSWQFSS